MKYLLLAFLCFKFYFVVTLSHKVHDHRNEYRKMHNSKMAQDIQYLFFLIFFEQSFFPTKILSMLTPDM